MGGGGAKVCPRDSLAPCVIQVVSKGVFSPRRDCAKRCRPRGEALEDSQLDLSIDSIPDCCKARRYSLTTRAVWEAISNIPGILPILAILAGAVVATIFSLAQVVNRARLVQRITQAEFELKRARDGACVEGGRIEKPSDTVIVNIHDRLVTYRQALRRTNEYARISRFILLPLLAGSLLGVGYAMATFNDLGHSERMEAQFKQLEQEVDEWRVKGRTIEEKVAMQASRNAHMAKEVEESTHEKEALRDRLKKTEVLLANEKKERIELEVLVGKAEQRLAVFVESHHDRKVDAETFQTIGETESAQESITEADSTLDLSREPSLEESDLSADDRMRLAVDATSLYTGRLKGQIAFEGRPRQSQLPWSNHRIYVLVRWGVSSWIVTEGHARVNSAGAVEGAFKVILPISTIRTLDVTAIATDKVYRRYQHVRFPDYKWKASTARIAVHRS